MNFKKILASVAAAALTVSAMSLSAFAETIDLGSGSTVEFNDAALAAMADAGTTVTINYNSPNGWDDIGIGGSGGELGDWKGEAFPANQGEGTSVLTSADIAAKLGVGSLEGLTYLKIEGYNSTEILGVVVSTADAPADDGTADEPTPEPEPEPTPEPDVTPDDAAPSEDGEPELPPELAELADELEELTEMEGLKYLSISGNDKGEFDGYLDTVFAAEIGLEASDVIVVAVAPSSEDTDISNWVVDLKGFDYNWGGWQGVSSDPGVVMLATNVQEILDANGFTMDDLQGFNLEISGIPAGEYEEAYVVAVMLVVSEDAVENFDEANGDTDGAGADPSKGSPDTGAEGVAVVAGLAIVAAGAIVVAKKRK